MASYCALVMHLPDEKYDMQIFRRLIPTIRLLPKGCVSKIENISMGLYKKPLTEGCTLVEN
jgi:hypothetical protein